jgi:hypothetical protein
VQTWADVPFKGASIFRHFLRLGSRTHPKKPACYVIPYRLTSASSRLHRSSISSTMAV